MASLDTGVSWYQLSVSEVIDKLKASSSDGLSDAEAKRRLDQYGLNELVERGGRSRWEIIKEQLTGVLTIILVLAAIISLFLNE